ncbi:MAG: hypothetical protein QXQ60_03455 [Thermofilum sp.]
MGLRLVGALFYVSKLYSVLVGAAFILIMTRNLSPEDFGAWGVISSILVYALMASFVNFWVTRLRAFGDESVTATGFALALTFSAAATALLALLSPGISATFGIPEAALRVVLAYVPVQYVNGALYASLYATRPAAAAASEVFFETFKLAAAAFFALRGEVTLTHALIAVLSGHVAQLAVLAYFTRRELSLRPRLETARRVLGYSWITALGAPIPLIASADVLLISHFSGNDAVAFYTIILPFANLIVYSYFLGRGLYQKLLTTDSGSAAAFTEEALRLVLVIGVPAALGSVALSQSLLYVMNPLYAAAAPVLRVASFTALLGSVNSILSDALQGVERADAMNAKPRELVGTAFFKLVVLSYAGALLRLAGVYAAVLLHADPLSTALYSRLAGLLVEVAVLACLAKWAAAKGFKLLPPGAVKFLAAGLAMYCALTPLSPLRIREVLLAVALGAAVYFAVLYAIDSWFRDVARQLYRRATSWLTREHRP